jgi:probable rRNA maturation factor
MSKVAVTIISHTHDTFDFSLRAVAGKVARTVLSEEKCPFDAEVSLTLCEDAFIQDVNREYRGIDAPTDVISFPGLEFETPGQFPETSPDCMDPDTGRVLLGDILVNTNRVLLQASQYGHSTLREYAFLVCHSMLHLCGYDHIRETDAGLMEEKQRIIMDLLHIPRDTTEETVRGIH